MALITTAGAIAAIAMFLSPHALACKIGGRPKEARDNKGWGQNFGPRLPSVCSEDPCLQPEELWAHPNQKACLIASTRVCYLSLLRGSGSWSGS